MSRVSEAANELTAIEVNGEQVEAIYCPNCGDPENKLGWADTPWAEDHWLEVNGQLACSVYCAAKTAGASERDAQLARAAKTQANARRAGFHEEADRDMEVLTAALAEREDGNTLLADIEKLTTESGEPHDGPNDEDAKENPHRDDSEAILGSVLGTDRGEN